MLASAWAWVCEAHVAAAACADALASASKRPIYDRGMH
jgi:hypothetical protein